MPDRVRYELVRGLIAVKHERDMSDEARWWAADEIEMIESTVTDPAVRGAFRAMLECAFEAGRLMEQKK